MFRWDRFSHFWASLLGDTVQHIWRKHILFVFLWQGGSSTRKTFCPQLRFSGILCFFPVTKLHMSTIESYLSYVICTSSVCLYPLITTSISNRITWVAQCSYIGLKTAQKNIYLSRLQPMSLRRNVVYNRTLSLLHNLFVFRPNLQPYDIII